MIVRLLYNAISRAGRGQSVKDALHNRQWLRDIVGPRTTKVLCQFIRIWLLIWKTVMDPLQSDRFILKWSLDGKYLVSFTYRAFSAGSTELLGVKEL